MKKLLNDLLPAWKSAAKLMLAVAVVVSSTMIYSVIAAPPGSPYNLGETLQPACAPGDANCTVVTPAASGANSDITSLSGLTTALSVPQGGTGLSSITAGRLLYASAANTLAELSLDPLLSTPAGVLTLDPTIMVQGENVSLLTNDAGYLVPGDNVSSLTNDANYVAVGDNVSGLTNDANYVAVGDNVSGLTNDANYITAAQVPANETDPIFTASAVQTWWTGGANASALTDDLGLVLVGDNISGLANDSGYITNAGETDQVWVAAEPNYANLGQAETIAANWDNTAKPWALNEIDGTVLNDAQFASAGYMYTDGSGGYSVVSPSNFVLADGSVDLTNNWTIANNNITLTNGTLTANTVSDGAGAGMNSGTVSATTLTDGTAVISGGTIGDGVGASLSGGTVTGSTLTDGTASMNAGSLTGVVGITASGTIQGGTLTDGAGASMTGGTVTATTITDGTASMTGGTVSDGAGASLNGGILSATGANLTLALMLTPQPAGAVAATPGAIYVNSSINGGVPYVLCYHDGTGWFDALTGALQPGC